MKNDTSAANTKLQNIIRALCVTAIAAMWLIAVFVYGASASASVLLAAFVIFYV